MRCCAECPGTSLAAHGACLPWWEPGKTHHGLISLCVDILTPMNFHQSTLSGSCQCPPRVNNMAVASHVAGWLGPGLCASFRCCCSTLVLVFLGFPAVACTATPFSSTTASFLITTMLHKPVQTRALPLLAQAAGTSKIGTPDVDAYPVSCRLLCHASTCRRTTLHSGCCYSAPVTAPARSDTVGLAQTTCLSIRLTCPFAMAHSIAAPRSCEEDAQLAKSLVLKPLRIRHHQLTGGVWLVGHGVQKEDEVCAVQLPGAETCTLLRKVKPMRCRAQRTR